MTDLAPKLAALCEYVRLEQDSQLDAEHSLGSVRVHVLNSERRARSKWSLGMRSRALILATLATLAAIFAAARVLRRAPLAVTADHRPLAVGEWIRVRNTAIPLYFSDNTEIVLEPGSRARLESVDAAGAHLAIETGQADVKVLPGRDGRWHLSLGPFGVDIAASQFDIAWNPDLEELSLSMREGKVLVSGCVLGEGRTLLAGERLSASCRERRFEVERSKSATREARSVADSAASPSDSEVAPLDSATPAELAAGPDSTTSGTPSRNDLAPLSVQLWQVLAREGQYNAALTAANASGFDLELNRASAEDLALLGELARLGGDGEASSKAYRTLRQRFPDYPGAPQQPTARPTPTR